MDKWMMDLLLTHVTLGTVFHQWQKWWSWKPRKEVTMEPLSFFHGFHGSLLGPCLPLFFHSISFYSPTLLYLLPELIVLELFILYHFFKSDIMILQENKTHRVDCEATSGHSERRTESFLSGCLNQTSDMIPDLLWKSLLTQFLESHIFLW